MKKLINMITITLSVLTLCFIEVCVAAPKIDNISGTLFESGKLIANESIIISGTNFGEKSTAAPAYFSNYENETTGGHPTSLNPVVNGGGIVATDQAIGAKSLKYPLYCPGGSFPNDEHFIRDVFDFGTGVEEVYITAWVRLNLVDSGTSWQWKSFYVSSNAAGYTVGDSNDTHAILNNWHYNTGKWSNTFAHFYYNNTANHSGSGDSLPADAYLFNTWQRVELYWKRSSSGGKADAKVEFRRVGRTADIENENNLISHADGNRMWRYVAIGQGLTNVTTTAVKLTAWYDNVYIDKTIARVEIGNNKDYYNCTYREIQLPIGWNTDSIEIKINKGSMSDDLSDKYIFVIDKYGAVSNGLSLSNDPFDFKKEK